MSILKRTKKRNWPVYQRGCEGSKEEKRKVFQKEFIEPDKRRIMVDFGSGTGISAVLLSDLFSNEESPEKKYFLVGLDISPEMLKRANSRKEEYKNVSVTWVRNDITKPYIRDECVDVVFSLSTLHEIYSHKGMEAFKNVINYIHRILKPGGRLIIRAGAKPKDEEVYVKFKKKEFEELFYKFAKDFEPHCEKGLRKGKYKIDFEKLENGMIRLNLSEYFEFLVKYFYKENWNLEVKERWGVLTPEQWYETLEDIGFKIIDKDIHLLPYFEKVHERDGIELYKEVNGSYAKTACPYSHIILVAEKA